MGHLIIIHILSIMPILTLQIAIIRLVLLNYLECQYPNNFRPATSFRFMVDPIFKMDQAGFILMVTALSIGQ
ncbi:MAG: hypothetical protein OI74_06190 [Gammaproteobacteria bacterium (ex Lamellibrachia satsuma)]|nr:MAG: hypothetical protein OI74_06190 [Gammaproteobacteria bacterium (ex Lamellibrachia satsuma)]RRS37509.1 MAG: hypothetical protein NV67_01030 [Gammaproteobacteria bacterium (ex Lamellibrachia satsuma)]